MPGQRAGPEPPITFPTPSSPPPAGTLAESPTRLQHPTGRENRPPSAAELNSSAVLKNSALPHIDTSATPLLDNAPNTARNTPLRSARTLSAGLHLETNLFPATPATIVAGSPTTPKINEYKARDDSSASASAEASAGAAAEPHCYFSPSTLPFPGLRPAMSSASMGSTLSASSALSSPALNAMTDLTPLPSPLLPGASPGPWTRAATDPSTTTGAESRSTSPTVSRNSSRKKKGYNELMSAAIEHNAAAKDRTERREPSHIRSRSISDYKPEALHNVRPRNVTVSSTTGSSPSDKVAAQGPELQREAYLAERRGLTQKSAVEHPSGLPTPPASNRSLSESEPDDAKEDEPPIEYLHVRQGVYMRNYRQIRLLGQGTFSRVVLATSEEFPTRIAPPEESLDPKQLVAIKIVDHGPAGGADEERVELSLKREIEILRSLCHPSLMHLRAFDFNDKQALLVLSYCAGGDLFDLASSQRDLLTPSLVQRMFAELVGAVQYLHDQLIVHRDIKLENVLLKLRISELPTLSNPSTFPNPIVILSDLGLSRPIPPPPASPLLTTRCGSEDYAAPEILLGQPYDGRATDAWALGVLLYALMEGRLPFDSPPENAFGPRRRVRGRPAHRIARCEWMWWRFGDEEGDWDPELKISKDWEGARGCVEGLLKKVSRGRLSVADLQDREWVQQGIQVEGGLTRIEDEGDGEENLLPPPPGKLRRMMSLVPQQESEDEEQLPSFGAAQRKMTGQR